MGNYTPAYSTTDVTEAATDGFAIAVITIVSFIGVIVLVGVIGYFWNKAKAMRR